MPYTLAKFFLWGLLMALAGGGVGWLLRSLSYRGKVASLRAGGIDPVEVDRLRGRVANLEPIVIERDRLRMELADVRGSTGGELGFSGAEDVTQPIARVSAGPWGTTTAPPPDMTRPAGSMLPPPPLSAAAPAPLGEPLLGRSLSLDPLSAPESLSEPTGTEPTGTERPWTEAEPTAVSPKSDPVRVGTIMATMPVRFEARLPATMSGT